MRFLKNIPFILKIITLFSGNAEPIRNNNGSIANSTMPIARNTMSISNNVSSSDLDNIDYILHKSHNIVSKIEETIGFNSANPEWIEALELKEAGDVNHSLSREATDFNQENVELTEVNEVTGATGFNPENIGLIQVKEVTYGLSYQNNDKGSSKVKLLISHKSKTYEWDTGINVDNKYKGQLSLTLVEDFGKTNKVGIISPGEGLNDRGEKYERLLFNIYMVELSKDGVSAKYSSEAKLQTNADYYNDGNLDNKYYFSAVVKTRNGDLIVFAHNFKNQQLVAWLLEPDENGQLKPLVGRKGIIERKLFKFDNPGQLSFSEKTIFYSQEKEVIIEGKVGKKTRIFPFNIEELAEKLRDGNKVDECLLANMACRINTTPSVKSEGEISFMQYVTNQKGKDLIAFIEKGQSSKKQKLFFVEASEKAKLVYKFTYPVEQLYVRSNGQGSFTVTAVSRKNIITFYVDELFRHSNVTFIPVSSIKSISDFASIINGYLTSTTEKITEQPSSAVPMVASSSTKITEITTEKESETSTAIIANSSVNTLQTTTESTKVTTHSTPHTITEDISQTTTPNGAKTTSSGSTQRVFTESSSTGSDRATLPSSTEYERSTAPLPSTTTYLPQPTFSPRTQLARAGRSNDTGAIAGGTIGTLIVLILAVFGAYKFIQRCRRCHYTQPAFELDSRSSSDPELCTQSTSSTNPHGGENILMTRYVSKNANSDPELDTQSTSPTNSDDAAITEGIPLDNISVGSTSLVSSSSPGSNPLYGSSRSPSPSSFSLSTNSHGDENVPMAQARPEVSPLIDVLVENVSPASRPLPGNSRSLSPSCLANVSISREGSKDLSWDNNDLL